MRIDNLNSLYLNNAQFLSVSILGDEINIIILYSRY